MAQIFRVERTKNFTVMSNHHFKNKNLTLKAKASRLLTSAVDGGYIKVMDSDTAPRYKNYIPYWA